LARPKEMLTRNLPRSSWWSRDIVTPGELYCICAVAPFVVVKLIPSSSSDEIRVKADFLRTPMSPSRKC
jgi:hypothetical protein